MFIKAKMTVRRLVMLLGSRSFFKLIVALLIVQAAWIALSGRYPMAFDEDFHLGIIRLYAHHLSPFWNGQPAGADAYGAVARDPSYLYQYLMSFPYRLVSLLTGNQTIQVIVLRFINIGLFAASLPLYRRLLLKTGASAAAVQACLAVLVLLPVVPFLAAQINYDNLLLPLTAAILLLTLRFSENLRAGSPLDVKSFGYLTILCMLASLVKYAFLPVAMAIGIYVLIRLVQTYRRSRDARHDLRAGWSGLSLSARGLLVALACASVLLFGERYLVNAVRYHTPVPDCAKVLTIKQCSAYGPWIRDYNFKINKVDFGPHKGPLAFMNEWLYGMWLRLFFALDGPPVFVTRGPLLVPAIGGIVFAVTGAAAALLAARRVFKHYNRRVLWLFTLSSAVYIAVLWLDEYRSFVRTGQPVAINGRYLLPVLPLVLLFGALGIAELLKRRQAVKLFVAVLAMLCLVWGGGALTFILRSNDSWYWPDQPVRAANHGVQRILGPPTPGFYDQTQFLR